MRISDWDKYVMWKKSKWKKLFFLKVKADENKNNTKCKSAFPCQLFLLQMEKTLVVGTAYNQMYFFLPQICLNVK